MKLTPDEGAIVSFSILVIGILEIIFAEKLYLFFNSLSGGYYGDNFKKNFGKCIIILQGLIFVILAIFSLAPFFRSYHD
ncbi:MAG TPA: hypothetical protein VK914_09595 [bacterium]|jgi:hypothetical protein|nr:hypothetical protein [bacterium]